MKYFFLIVGEQIYADLGIFYYFIFRSDAMLSDNTFYKFSTLSHSQQDVVLLIMYGELTINGVPEMREWYS